MALNSVERLKKIEQVLDPKMLTQVGYQAFYSATPRRSGNARRHTQLRTTTIVADYPYASRLENNWSPQTHGQGMIKPAIEAIRKYIKQKLGA